MPINNLGCLSDAVGAGVGKPLRWFIINKLGSFRAERNQSFSQGFGGAAPESASVDSEGGNMKDSQVVVVIVDTMVGRGDG